MLVGEQKIGGIGVGGGKEGLRQTDMLVSSLPGGRMLSWGIRKVLLGKLQ